MLKKLLVISAMACSMALSYAQEATPAEKCACKDGTECICAEKCDCKKEGCCKAQKAKKCCSGGECKKSKEAQKDA